MDNKTADSKNNNVQDSQVTTGVSTEEFIGINGNKLENLKVELWELIYS